MDHSDRPGAQRPPRYPAPARYEHDGVPYDEYAPYEQISSPLAPGDGEPWPMSVEDDGPSMEEDYGPSMETASSGLLAGPVTGILGAAVALGVANLAAAFIRPQASPIMAVKDLVGNGKTIPLLGPYVAIALIAIVIGFFAWRRVQVGVAGFGLFGLAGAFAALTRPGSHATDAIPSLVGGIVAIVSTVWLVRAGNRQTAYGSRARGLLADGSAGGESFARESLGDEMPAYETPAYGALVFGSPAYESSPSYESPRYESPRYESPAYRTGRTA